MAGVSGYEGASTRPRLAAWQELDAAVSALLATEGDELRKRSRGLVRKNPWAKNAEDCFVANAIGTGIMPEPLHPDAETRKLLKDAWRRSADEMDADGRTDHYGQQAVAAREIFQAGEVLARFRPRYTGDGLLVPLQVQLIEAEHLPLRKTGDAENGNKIRSGIEFTPYGKRAAYHLYREHPGLGGMSLAANPQEITRVGADNILHCFSSLRAGQWRGQPWLAPVMVTLYELDLFVDAVLVRQKLSNMLIGWQRSMTDEGAALVAEATAANGESAGDGGGFGSLQPGMLLDLSNTGTTLEWSKPPDPAASLPEFLKMMLHSVASGIGMPFSLLNWDTSDVNFSSMRGELSEFRRRIEQFQFQTMIFQFCQPVWRRWVRDAVLAGVVPKPRDAAGWTALYDVEWRTPKWSWVNPLQDVMTEKEMVRCGFKSRTAVIHELGYDPEQVDAEIAADNERADSLGIVTDSDPRQTADSGVAQTAATDQSKADETAERKGNAPASASGR